jgi:hypothetical protein
MTIASRRFAGCVYWIGCTLVVCVAFATLPASASSSPPASPLTPELLFALAILGPMLVPVAAYAAGLLADRLQRNKKD